MVASNVSLESLRQQTGNPALLERAKRYALAYMDALDGRDVFPSPEALDQLDAFQEALPDDPTDPAKILDQLHRLGSPATVAQTRGRYFGFVNGGIVPAAMAAKWLADVWDQNAALHVISPVASVLERVCERWLVDLLNLPAGTAAGFLTGTSTATFCGLAAGRDRLLRQLGWDLKTQGLFGAPAITSATLEHIQASETCWCGGATWDDEPVIRISVCSLMTTREDIDRSVRAFVEARAQARS